ncbi:amino acid ABC transporter permease [Halomonas sp. FeN2]|uniref:Amino acid ABC transporter permease n=2 Tax=Vreelandella TaxID=3137766 RepID=A0ABM7GPK4_9GAMM|nr:MULTISPECIES: amino acid ABC transporter permease [Halomonas]TDW00125.1 amino acid ABC transporter membrane protein 2 (PAAT family) [Halomonas alkaliantarctica]BBI52653.1 amino acid ABC transporter permease [Halomonas olivaria]MDN3559820.1 amino acid ABC transporter permease [Halomonas neptunia]UBR50867.1 amino acid ABC transporter permease [Halomonas sp. FeN2]WQH11407.1 amino acid ABC transporter permease [Halomonas neptunia]|tara:strand:- start:2160 stop:2828 length:669 start_codon:yes stop_codon:yes gene_type:complete
MFSNGFMFSTSFTWNDLLFLLQGAWVTLLLTFWSMLLGTVMGVSCGLLRALLPRATIPLGWFLDIFRSVPLLIQFVLFNSLKSIVGLDWSAFTVGCVVLGVYVAAFCTEIVRSGVLSVPQNLRLASRSLGMTYWQDLRYVVMPLATRVAFPGWLNLSLSAMKDTALVMWIGIIELLRASQAIVTRIQEPLLVLCIAGLIYYLISLVVSRLGAQVEKRWQQND